MDENLMRVMQDRKGVSIAFFNATNSAIALVASMPATDPLRSSENNMLVTVSRIRDYFLGEYQVYYKEVIQSVGANYNAQDTIKKVEAVTTMQELSNLWLILSADEKKDGEIRKVVQAKRDSFK